MGSENVKILITSEVPVEHETLKSGRNGTGRDGTGRDGTGRDGTTTDGRWKDRREGWNIYVDVNNKTEPIL